MDIKSDEILDRLREVKFIARTKNINEADTRHKVIDFVLHDFLAWPKNRVALESYISPGFADYVLQKTNGDDLLFIEAKKAGRFFELPIAHCETETSCYISIKKLLTDSNVKEAMEQVRAYCMDTGCEYACITNGVTWIFFKTFEKGKRWETLQAFVVRNLNFFSHEYTKAINTLSFTAITERSSLPTLLSSAPPKDRSVYFTKQKIPSYSHPIKPNSLASSLRPIVTKYFGVIADYDTEFMDRCYVSQREYVGTSDGMRALIMDSLSPYFEEFGVRQLEDTGRGGRLGGRLKKNVRDKRQGEVLVLFGGKGSGKSTFLKRLLHHNPPPWLVQHAAIAIVDLLKIPEDLALIRQTIWERLVVSLDTDRLLDEDREMLTSTLFADRFEVAERQDLAGLSKTSETYNLQLNALVAAWKSDLPYCAQRLVAQLSAKDRGAIVVVDNTDQYPKEVQDFCFATAQEISQRLKCVTLISM